MMRKKEDNQNTAWMTPGIPVWVQIGSEEPETCRMFYQGKITKVDSAGGVAFVQYLEEEVQRQQGNQQGQQSSLNKLPECVAVSKIFKRGKTIEDINYNGFKDMVFMDELNEPEIVNNLQIRFNKQITYTYIGPTLVGVNPYRQLSKEKDQAILHDCQKLLQEMQVVDARELEPHTYSIAAQAFSQMLQKRKNQAIVISGESGAGKTENAKLAMQFLTTIKFNLNQKGEELSEIKETSIEEKILSCNPILEAFGNAKTIRNDNSSRFGKYVHILVDSNTCMIQGATVINYLLEKSRVTVHSKGERNYHIFYHLLKGCTGVLKQSLFLSDKEAHSFDYLKSGGCYEVKGINDEELFNEVNQSLNNMGFEQFEQNTIWKILSGILHLGNVQFDASSLTDTQPCSIINKEYIEKASHLLDININIIEKCLLMKSRRVGQEVMESPLSFQDVFNNRDTLAKTLYDRLFDWLVDKLNQRIFNKEEILTNKPRSYSKAQIQISGQRRTSIAESMKRTNSISKNNNIVNKPLKARENQNLVIGLLDIFGFEVFETNSFEQLCINYANERLQQLYIAYIFKSQEEELAAEGLSQYQGLLSYSDNQPLIDLLDKYPKGIFDILDECSALASSSDSQFFGKTCTAHKSNTYFQPSKIQQEVFLLRHTAKTVQYSASGFRAKNKADLSQDIVDCVSSSHNNLITIIFAGVKQGEEKGNSSKNSKVDKFLGAKFRQQMKQLMEELMSSDCHFIRCIKPNEIKASNLFLQGYLLIQIRYLGVLEAIRARQNGFPFRRSYKDFYNEFHQIPKEYRGVSDKKFNAEQLKGVCDILCKSIMKSASIPEGLLLGKSKIFANVSVSDKFESILKEWQSIRAVFLKVIQKSYRKSIFRRKVKLWIKTMKKVSRLFKRFVGNIKMKVQRRKFMRIKKGVKLIIKLGIQNTSRQYTRRWKQITIVMLAKEKILRQKCNKMMQILESIYNRNITQCLRNSFVKIDNCPLKQKIIPKEIENVTPTNIIESIQQKQNEEKHVNKVVEASKQNVLEELGESNIYKKEEDPAHDISLRDSFLNSEEIFGGGVSFSNESTHMSLNFSMMENQFNKGIEITRQRQDSIRDSFNPPPQSTDNEENNQIYHQAKEKDDSDDEKEYSLYQNYLFILTNNELQEEQVLCLKPERSPDAIFSENNIHFDLKEKIKSNNYFDFCKLIYKKHKRWGRAVPFEENAYFSPLTINKSLIPLSPQLEPLALTIWMMILKYTKVIKSKKSSQHQAQKLLNLIFEQDQNLQEEVMLQITRQLQKCTNEFAKRKAFQLMAVVTSCISASSQTIYPLLNCFYSFTLSEQDEGNKMLAKFIFQRLRKNYQLNRVYILMKREILAYEKANSVCVSVQIYPKRNINMQVESYTDIGTLLRNILEKLNISKNRAHYCLYERITIRLQNKIIKENESLVGEEENVMDVISSWHKEEILMSQKMKECEVDGILVFRIKEYFKFKRYDVDAIASYFAHCVDDFLRGSYNIQDKIVFKLASLKLANDSKAKQEMELFTSSDGENENKNKQLYGNINQEQQNKDSVSKEAQILEEILHKLNESDIVEEEEKKEEEEEDHKIKEVPLQISKIIAEGEPKENQINGQIEYSDYFPINFNKPNNWLKLLEDEYKRLTNYSSAECRSMFLNTLKKRSFLFLSHQFQVLFYSVSAQKGSTQLITAIIAVKPFECIFIEKENMEIIDQFSLREISKFRKLSNSRMTIVLGENKTLHLEMPEVETCLELLQYYLKNTVKRDYRISVCD